jgi:hypothetical protein
MKNPVIELGAKDVSALIAPKFDWKRKGPAQEGEDGRMHSASDRGSGAAIQRDEFLGAKFVADQQGSVVVQV